MKQGTGITASVAAIASSIASVACCLPVGLVGAIGAAGVSGLLPNLTPWLLGLSVVLLAFGFWQQRRATQCDRRSKAWGRVMLCFAAAVVSGMILFPQQIAGFIADRLWP